MSLVLNFINHILYNHDAKELFGVAFLLIPSVKDPAREALDFLMRDSNGKLTLDKIDSEEVRSLIKDLTSYVFSFEAMDEIKTRYNFTSSDPVYLLWNMNIEILHKLRTPSIASSTQALG